ncbi:hypothetical protein [Nocardia xishanensis]
MAAARIQLHRELGNGAQVVDQLTEDEAATVLILFVAARQTRQMPPEGRHRQGRASSAPTGAYPSRQNPVRQVVPLTDLLTRAQIAVLAETLETGPDVVAGLARLGAEGVRSLITHISAALFDADLPTLSRRAELAPQGPDNLQQKSLSELSTRTRRWPPLHGLPGPGGNDSCNDVAGGV